LKTRWWFDPDPSLGIHFKYKSATSPLEIGAVFGYSPGNLPLIGALPSYIPYNDYYPHAAGGFGTTADLIFSKIFQYNPQFDAGWWLGSQFYIKGW
jgi:hypothetical protein